MYSPINGTVRYNNESEGKLVIYADYGDSMYYPNYSYFFFHLSDIENGFAIDPEVNEGQVFGNEGSTGNSSGPHLHFGVEQGKTNTTGYENEDDLSSENPYYCLDMSI